MMLGLVIGICALSILSSIGEGTRREALQKFKNMLGTFDTVMIRPGAGRTRGWYPDECTADTEVSRRTGPDRRAAGSLAGRAGTERLRSRCHVPKPGRLAGHFRCFPKLAAVARSRRTDWPIS